MARGECTTQYESMASYNTNYIVFDLIDFFWLWLKSDHNTDLKKQSLCLWKMLYWHKISLV